MDTRDREILTQGLDIAIRLLSCWWFVFTPVFVFVFVFVFYLYIIWGLVKNGHKRDPGLGVIHGQCAQATFMLISIFV